jgi:Myb-like DNA-binding protein FlbD
MGKRDYQEEVKANQTTRRKVWSLAEDKHLIQLVHTHGKQNWVLVAQLIRSRTSKQCRERYYHRLKSSLNHEPISPEEGLLIEGLVARMGNRWAEIARKLDGRSQYAVKNWWNGRKRAKKVHVGSACVPCKRAHLR